MDLFSDIAKKPVKALSVSQLVRKMKRAVVDACGKSWIEGEVSNLRKQASGHWYFSLKDERAQISCAMFYARNKEGSEFLEDGTKVRVFAEATVYEARGQLQVVVEKVERCGLGDLQARFEALKKKLNEEGLFSQSRKQELPDFPRVIGLVTSPSGAALQDILHVLTRRAPWVQPVVFPVRVQGAGAEHEIAEGIRKLNAHEAYGYPKCDVIIVGRGGGSLEDLWCFNEEVVARAIAASEIPLISAVGHEIDFTIADFAADLRAPTPSAAAEQAVPDVEEMLHRCALKRRALWQGLVYSYRAKAQLVDENREMLVDEIEEQIRTKSRQVREMQLLLKAQHPYAILQRRMDRVQQLRKMLEQRVANELQTKASLLEKNQGLLRTLGPESVFKRGFSITLGADGKALHSTQGVKRGDTIRTKLIDGEVVSEVQ